MKGILAIRAATTVTSDSSKEIRQATAEMVKAVLLDNQLESKDIISVLFTLTHDLRSLNPATAVREELNWKDIVMLCAQEALIEGGLPFCIRGLFHIRAEKDKVKHVYLNGAKSLRADWCNE